MYVPWHRTGEWGGKRGPQCLLKNSPLLSTEVGSLSLPKGSSQTRVRTQVSLIAGEFFTSNTGMGSLTLLQQISATQESNQGLLHCR